MVEGFNVPPREIAVADGRQVGLGVRVAGVSVDAAGVLSFRAAALVTVGARLTTWPLEIKVDGALERTVRVAVGQGTDAMATLPLGDLPPGKHSVNVVLGTIIGERAPGFFHYAYAVFHAPTYRSRYAAFLKTDFPRLPLPPDAETSTLSPPSAQNSRPCTCWKTHACDSTASPSPSAGNTPSRRCARLTVTSRPLLLRLPQNWGPGASSGSPLLGGGASWAGGLLWG